VVVVADAVEPQAAYAVAVEQVAVVVSAVVSI
jgi:hypothetical protein